MSTVLRPTAARIALLQAVADGKVRHWPASDWVPEAWDNWITADRGDLKVTARIKELLAAGWVEHQASDNDVRMRLYTLTAVGRAVLDTAPRKDRP